MLSRGQMQSRMRDGGAVPLVTRVLRVPSEMQVPSCCHQILHVIQSLPARPVPEAAWMELQRASFWEGDMCNSGELQRNCLRVPFQVGRAKPKTIFATFS